MSSTSKRTKGKNLATSRSAKLGKWEVTDSTVVRLEMKSDYCSDEFRVSARQAWSSLEADGKSEIDLEGGAVVIKSPFNCFCLPQLLANQGFVQQLKENLLQLKFNDKSNDLYKFRQSEDLKSIGNSTITAIRKFLYQDFRLWLSGVTGIELDETIDMSCSQYDKTDTLLCHDDELEGRRIAFILYLVDEDWCESDGGALDLFSADENNQPTKIIKSLTPRWNSVTFFEVTPKSFHQVAEVLTENKCRLSVSGWFHGKSIARPSPYKEAVHLLKPMDMEEEEFYAWINPAYLDPSTQGDIQESFGDKSEIQLQEFLHPSKYAALCQALRLPEVTWTQVGPANKRHYQVASDASAIVGQARNFFQSEAFFLVLSSLTGLKLHQLAPTPSSSENESDADEGNGSKSSRSKPKPSAIDPCCKIQVSKWQSGCYTLLHDEDADSCEYALDVWLFLGADNWQLSHGGQISYVALGEDEELLTVCPSNNCLALVYRDKDTLRFVKHINSTSGDLQHFMLNAVYYDQPPAEA